jgi:starch phosphorylase
MALAYTVRDRMLRHYIATLEAIADANTPIKVVAYLSAEFLTVPHLGSSLINLDIWKATEEALTTVGQTLSELPARSAAVAMKSVVVDPGRYDWEGDLPREGHSPRP